MSIADLSIRRPVTTVMLFVSMMVVGLIAAGGIAAALSTAAGLLLAISSAISHDLIKNTINPNIHAKPSIRSTKPMPICGSHG